jgi:NhaA family Na+:H+ antiporter
MMITAPDPLEVSSLTRPEPIHLITRPIVRFMHVASAGGVILLASSIAALLLANSRLSEQFLAIWQIKVGVQIGDFGFRHSIQHIINDGLMAIFFFVIGLEIKREIVLGELHDLRKALLPIAGAIGGMFVPATIYLVFLSGQPGQQGWGIPMATDIAFVVGCMAILGSRVPKSLRILVLSLAIADDIGAILIIALVYTESINVVALSWGVVGLAAVIAAARLGVRSFGIYILLGAGIWFAFHESGIHATIAGVALGLLTPARSYITPKLLTRILRGAEEELREGPNSLESPAVKAQKYEQILRETVSPLEYLENRLHPWVGFLIMPLFALANAGVPVHVYQLGTPVSIGILLGLAVGKPVGILLTSWLAVTFRLADLPEGVTWKILLAGGCLAGIGFTMALFIAGLAFETSEEAALLDTAKIGVLLGSVLSAIIGMALLLFLTRERVAKGHVEPRLGRRSNHPA